MLVNRMCEENAVQSLLDFNFAGLSDEVEAILSFKARNVDPRMKPSYSKILYSWYMSRGDYRNGGLTWHPLSISSDDICSVLDNVSACAESSRAYNEQSIGSDRPWFGGVGGLLACHELPLPR